MALGLPPKGRWGRGRFSLFWQAPPGSSHPALPKPTRQPLGLLHVMQVQKPRKREVEAPVHCCDCA